MIQISLRSLNDFDVKSFQLTRIHKNICNMSSNSIEFCPVLRPTYHEFQYFTKYIKSIEPIVHEHGIVKVELSTLYPTRQDGDRNFINSYSHFCPILFFFIFFFFCFFFFCFFFCPMASVVIFFVCCCCCHCFLFLLHILIFLIPL